MVTLVRLLPFLLLVAATSRLCHQLWLVVVATMLRGLYVLLLLLLLLWDALRGHNGEGLDRGHVQRLQVTLYLDPVQVSDSGHCLEKRLVAVTVASSGEVAVRSDARTVGRLGRVLVVVVDMENSARGRGTVKGVEGKVLRWGGCGNISTGAGVGSTLECDPACRSCGVRGQSLNGKRVVDGSSRRKSRRGMNRRCRYGTGIGNGVGFHSRW